jgi:ABC-type multidrug transport system ATPase subunit
MSTNGAVLSIRGLERRFGAHEVIRRLDLSLEPGDRVALWGPNGSGKTTVLRCVAGTLAPSRGEVLVGRYPAGALQARRLLGASLAQERSFYMRLTGAANLLFFAQLRWPRKREARRYVDEIVEELELAEIAAERVDRCSSGMTQQLALARAMLGDPALLVLDEPTRSLDEDARWRLWGAVERRARLSVLLASHHEKDVDRCGKRIDLPT